MIPPKKLSNRNALGFKDSVLLAFNFLLENGRFNCTEANDYIVRFESSTVSVLVTHDPLSYEISVVVGLVSDPEAVATVEEIAKLFGAPTLQSLGNCEATSVKTVNFIVSELAQLLRKYGDVALRGEQRVFQQIKTVRSCVASAYTQSLQVGFAIEQSQEAWQQNDYRRVVELLLPYQKWLTGVQLKRLQYAQKHKP